MRVIYLMFFLFISNGCSQFNSSESLNKNKELIHLIVKSNDSCYEYISENGKYSKIVEKNSQRVSVPTEIEADHNYMYLIKRTPLSLSKLSNGERSKLEAMLIKDSKLMDSYKNYLYFEGDIIIAVYSDDKIDFCSQ